MTLDDFRNGINDYTINLENTEYSDNTINKYTLALRNFIAFAVENDHCEVICKNCLIEFKEYLHAKYALSTANLYIIAINKYLRYIRGDDLCIKTFKTHNHNSLENCLSVEEYQLMLRAAKAKKNNMIYYVMRALASTGIRFKGLEYFTVSSIKKGRFSATNKGKTRVIIIPSAVCKELSAYCKLKEISSGYIFHARNIKNPISEVTVLRWMKAVAKESGVDPDRAFPHNLRHLFARTYMEKHNNLGELADILGHSKIETTRIYTRASLEERLKHLDSLGL